MFRDDIDINLRINVNFGRNELALRGSAIVGIDS
jgi:hypothetical protein